MNVTDTAQWPLSVVKRFDFEDLVDGDAVAAITLPPGAIVTGGSITVVTAWDSGTTATIDIGDSDPDRYTASPIDLTTAARTALTLTGYKHTAEDELVFTLVEAGTAATEGEAVVELTFVIEGRDSEVVT